MPVVHLFHLLRRTLLYRLIHDAQFTYVVSVQSVVSFDVLRTVFFRVGGILSSHSTAF